MSVTIIKAWVIMLVLVCKQAFHQINGTKKKKFVCKAKEK